MNINQQVLRLSIPSILANITIPLVGLVDTAIVGHLADAQAIGGIAIGTMLFDLLYWNFGFLRVGTGGLTAQAFGQHDNKRCAKLLTQSLTIALAATITIWLIQSLFVNAVLACVPTSQQVANFAKQYFYIRIWAAPATLFLMTFKGWCIGMQDTISPMATDILVNVVNIAASYLLAVHSPLGTMGVAYGTLIAQYAGLILALIILLRKYKYVFAELQLSQLISDKQAFKQLMTLNANLFIRSLCFMIVYVGFTTITAGYGDANLSASNIIMKLFMLFSYLIDGFAYAGEALVGQFIGNKQQRNQIKPTIRTLFLWSGTIALCTTLLFATLAPNIYQIMTSDNNVLNALQPLTPWLIAMPIVSALAFIWDGIYTGATAGTEIRNGIIFAAIAFIGGYAATYRWLGLNAVFLAYFLHLIVRVIYLTAKWNSVYDRETAK